MQRRPGRLSRTARESAPAPRHHRTVEDVLGDLRSRRVLGGFKKQMSKHDAVSGLVYGYCDRVPGACQGDEASVLSVASVGPDQEGQAAQRQAPNRITLVATQQLHAGIAPPGQVDGLVIRPLGSPPEASTCLRESPFLSHTPYRFSGTPRSTRPVLPSSRVSRY